MKLAIVHDYLVNRGGAERVVAAMHRAFPDAPIFTSLFHPEATYADFADADVRPSRLQRFSRDPAAFRRLLPLFPRAFASMDLAGYDVVVSSSSGFAHRVRPRDGARHIVYCYTPPRFLWDASYDLAGLMPRWARPAVRPVRAWLRRGDLAAARRPDVYLAVSGVTRGRIATVYRRDAEVLYPPVDVDRFAAARAEPGSAYLFVGRMLAYRNVELAVRAFTEAGRELVLVGDGPARAAAEAAAGPTVRFAGVVSDEELLRLYGGCRGVVVPGVEDLGLIPLEANAAGRPAIALDAGGARETVIDGVTGFLFAEPTTGSLLGALARADATELDPASLRAHARHFSEPTFAAGLRAVVEGAD